MRRVSLFLLLIAFSPAFAHAEKCPSMLIVLDRSFSMNESGKWGAAKEAIAAFTPTRESVMRFGLRVFPARGDRCGGGEGLVASDFYSAPAIVTSLAAVSPGGSTPTADAIREAGISPDLADATRRRFLILITDGDATCPDEANVPLSHSLAVAEVTKLAQTGIKTFVVGFGQDASPARLDELAVAGGAPRAGAVCDNPAQPGTIPCKYYDASDAASLEGALDAIAQAASGELQGNTCDDSCYVPGGCPEGERCVANVASYQNGTIVLNNGKCEPDPCAGVLCGATEFCREGACYAACLDYCPAPNICQDGACVADPCVENPAACICPGGCPRYLVCIAATCQDDPCRSITCPAAAPWCSLGSCYAAPEPPTPLSDAGVEPPRGGGSDDSGVGCSCATGGAAAIVPAALILLPWLLTRRRRSSG